MSHQEEQTKLFRKYVINRDITITRKLCYQGISDKQMIFREMKYDAY